MKFGCCISHEKFTDAAMFDYVELGLSSIAALTDAEFDAVCQRIGESGVNAYACNGFFPGDIAIVGDNADWARIDDYAAMTAARAHQLGVKLLVLGSGRSRTRNGLSVERATGDFIKTLGVISKHTLPLGITIAIEPLRYKECDFINTVVDGADIAKAAALPNVGGLVDFYHFYCNGELLDSLVSVGAWIRHVHIAEPVNRRYPDDSCADSLRQWSDTLRTIGYDGGVSVEGGTQDFAHDAPVALNLLKEYFA